MDANLSVLALATPATTTGQQPVAVRIKVGNSGPTDAIQATLTLNLPTDSGFSANNAAGQGWTCQNMTASIVCNIASIPVGDAPDLTLDVIPPFVQTSFTIKASISSPAFDVNMANNTRDLVISNSAPCMNAACGMGGTGGMDGGTGGMNGGGQKTGCQMGPQQTASPWLLFAFAALCLLGRRHFRVLRGSFSSLLGLLQLST